MCGFLVVADFLCPSTFGQTLYGFMKRTANAIVLLAELRKDFSDFDCRIRCVVIIQERRCSRIYSRTQGLAIAFLNGD